MTLLAWTLAFLRPHRGRVIAITVLAVVEVGLVALAPWPLKAVVDNVLGGQPLPAPFAALVQPLVGTNTVALLLLVVFAGLLLLWAAGVAIFFALSFLTCLCLRRWHEGVLRPER